MRKANPNHMHLPRGCALPRAARAGGGGGRGRGTHRRSTHTPRAPAASCRAQLYAAFSPGTRSRNFLRTWELGTDGETREADRGAGKLFFARFGRERGDGGGRPGAGAGQRGAGAGLLCGQFPPPRCAPQVCRPCPPPPAVASANGWKKGFQAFSTLLFIFLSLVVHGHTPLMQWSGMPPREQGAPPPPRPSARKRPVGPFSTVGKCRTPAFEAPAEKTGLTPRQVIAAA